MQRVYWDNLSVGLVNGISGSSQYCCDFFASGFFFFPLDAPKVTMPRRTPGYYLQPGRILCSVDSLLPFTVSFFRNGVTLGVDQYFKCVNVSISNNL
jgi:hypothetical protein